MLIRELEFVLRLCINVEIKQMRTKYLPLFRKIAIFTKLLFPKICLNDSFLNFHANLSKNNKI